MQLSDIPAKFNIPFANSAIAPYIRPIPQNPTGTPGQAALTTGFPSENFNPVAAGGVPPFGADFNGLLNQSTAWNRWQATGRVFPPYDSTFQTAVAGYPRGSIVESLVENFLFYISLVDNNVTNPDTGGAGWAIWSRRISANTDLYVNGSTGNDANNGLTPATAKRTAQAALLTAWSFPPSQFIITIHIAAGSYAEAVATPGYSGPTVVIDGTTASTVTFAPPTNGAAFSVSGPNTLQVKNLTVQTSGGITTANGFTASNGATMTTSNTASNGVAGAVFYANNGGFIFPGSHTYNAGTSVGYIFSSQVSSVMKPNGTHTFAGALTIAQLGSVASQCGQIDMGFTGGQITFSGAGGVTGTKWGVSLNATLVATGLGGPNSLPGTINGSATTGGQAV